MKIGDFRTRQKVTGKLFLGAVGSAQKRDYGNILMNKMNPKVDRAQQLTAGKGYMQVTHEEPGKIDWRYQTKLDEHHTDLIGLLHLAAAPQAVNQNVVNAAAWPVGGINGVKQGYSYYVGAMGLTAFTVTDKTLNTDYTIDMGSGMLYIVPGGGINDNDNIAGTLTAPALSFSQYSALTQTFARFDARFLVFDQNTQVPREVVTGTVEVAVTDWGENDGQKFNEVQIEILWVTQPNVQVLELT